MTFEQVWNDFAIGQRVRVSNGEAEPGGGPEGIEFKVWRSHNFEGELFEKIDEDPRSLAFRLDEIEDEGVRYRVGYTIAEGGGHSFEAI
jgi:hypothetical protein